MANEPTPAPESKPFWMSRGFWVSLGTLLTNLLALLGMVHVNVDPATQAQILGGFNTLLGFLAMIFRWQADGPLTVSKKQ